MTSMRIVMNWFDYTALSMGSSFQIFNSIYRNYKTQWNSIGGYFAVN